jgi:hypothetical protein
VAFGIIAAAEAFTHGGWGGLLVAIVALSAIPSLVLGAILRN